MDTHLLFLSHAVGTETVQEYVHALGTSLFIGKTRTSNITVFIHLFQQSTFYAEVIFYHISHFSIPLFPRGEGLRPLPILYSTSKPNRSASHLIGLPHGTL